MNRTHSLVVVCLTVFSATVAAQSGQIKEPVKPVAINTTPAKDPEVERLRLERRARAQALLTSLANDAGTFNDPGLRARILAQVADLLWEIEPDRARNLFRKAWDAAEIADADGQRRMEEDARAQQSKSGNRSYSVVSPPDLRKEVLRLAVKHEARLGEEFLAKLKETDAAAGAKNDRSPFRESNPAAAHRVDVAKDLLSSGETERAMQFASPILNTINKQAIDFLTTLRTKNAALADERYLAMLTMAAANPQTDLNTVGLLFSYLFTPNQYGMLLGSGALPIGQRVSGGTAPPDVAPALRAAFFRLTAEVLMRPVQPDQDQSTANVFYKYSAIRNFLPWFEQFAVPELTAGVRNQLEVMAAMVPENQRLPTKEPAREEPTPVKPETTREQSLLQKIDSAKTSGERDKLYLELAVAKAEAGDLAAKDYAGKIDDSDLRQAVRAYIDAALAMRAIERKDAEQALELARNGEMTRLVKVWTMARAARLLMVKPKPDRDRVLLILEDAAAEARRMDGSDPDRARAFLAVSSAWLAIDRNRGWDSMTDAVKAANSAPEFTGADGTLSFQLGRNGGGSMHQHSMPEFNVADVFRLLAGYDFDRAVALAGVFEREGPRANAVMAIALTVLNK